MCIALTSKLENEYYVRVDQYKNNYNLKPLPIASSPKLTSSYLNNGVSDSFQKQPIMNNEKQNYQVYKHSNAIHLISFKALSNYENNETKKPEIRTGLSGDSLDCENIYISGYLPRGEVLPFEIVDSENDQKDIFVTLPGGGNLGKIPESIKKALIPTIIETPSDFNIKLYGTTNKTRKNPANVLIDIEYNGDKKDLIHANFNKLLYKNTISPEEVLNRLLGYKKVLYGEEVGTEKIKEAEKAISTITKTLEDPKNQKILLIGHNKPDGDTLGSCLGLKAALDYMNKEQVDIAIDDVVTGFLRNSLDTETIKRSANFISSLNDGINSRMKSISNEDIAPEQLQELYGLQHVKNHYNEKISPLEENDKYDVVVILDVPTPTKISKEIKKYTKDAKKIIYIDHHPFQRSEWQKEQDNDGINIDKIKKQHLYWTETKMPANTMLVSIIIDKLLPELSYKFRDSLQIKNGNLAEKRLINNMAQSLVVGTNTDTGGYRRGISKTEEDEKLPPEKKVSFAPAALSDWLLSLTNGDVTRRTIKKAMKYDVPNMADYYFPEDFVDFYNTEKESHEILETEIPTLDEIFTSKNNISCADIAENLDQNTKVYPELGLGISKIKFDSIKKFLRAYNMEKSEINMQDIIAAYKFNKYTIAMKYAKKNYEGFEKYKVADKYEDKKISVMIREEEKAGELNTRYHKATTNSLGFSFRSPEGTNYAGILATLFNGGGHASAAGGSISGQGVTSDSKITLYINGKKSNSFNEMYNVAKTNYENNYYDKLDDNFKIEIKVSDDGIAISDLISGVVKEIRQNS